ncbi:MaoC/PaaZ C-terminal domain-containing protein [Corticibacterium sp. UT-5YL-CI-8]|nr:MaoC/PaaZ C-terminal domain-containing protein [Tianweitania sp. UT-5YL-CI-8]
MLNIDKLKQYSIPDSHMTVTKRDTMLYALGVGLGSDPMDRDQLQFVYEQGLKSLPTMATVVAAPHSWVKKADVGSSGKSVHAGIMVEFLRPIPVEGEFVGKSSLGEVLDKGPGKAALVTTSRSVYEVGSADPVFKLVTTSMLRGDGGFGGPSQPVEADTAMPTRKPDAICDMPTLPQQALIYRLSGDYNPLHADPAVAQKQGFPRPILHGLGTFGITGHALIKTLCGYNPDRLKAMGGRFSKPVYPGEMLRIKMWDEGGHVAFQTTVPTRNDEVVLDFGFARLG